MRYSPLVRLGIIIILDCRRKRSRILLRIKGRNRERKKILSRSLSLRRDPLFSSLSDYRTMFRSPRQAAPGFLDPSRDSAVGRKRRTFVRLAPERFARLSINRSIKRLRESVESTLRGFRVRKDDRCRLYASRREREREIFLSTVSEQRKPYSAGEPKFNPLILWNTFKRRGRRSPLLRLQPFIRVFQRPVARVETSLRLRRRRAAYSLFFFFFFFLHTFIIVNGFVVHDDVIQHCGEQ